MTDAARVANVLGTMSSPNPAPFNEPWMERFSNNGLRKGLDYYQHGLVSELEFSDDGTQFWALVRGSGPQAHEVEVDLDFDDDEPFLVDGFCTCEVEVNCKHVVAAIFAAVAQHPDLLGGKNGQTAAQPRTHRPQALPQEFQQWLNGLSKAAAAPGSVSDLAPQPKDRLLYLLTIEQTSGKSGLKLVTRKARLLKSGRYGTPQWYSLSNALGPTRARFLFPVDAKIARHISAASPDYFSDEVFLRGEEGLEILSLVLETGRCHWENVNHPAVRLGPARPGAPCWITHANGLQHPSFLAIPPATAILPLQPPWYVDIADGTIGPLETPLLPGVAEAWLRAPGVSPAQAVTLNEALAERFPAQTLPRPQALEIEQLPAGEPVPCLHFSSVRLQWWESPWGFSKTGMDGTPVHVARLWFDYHGLRAEAIDTECEVIEQFKDGKLLRAGRDWLAEKRAIERMPQVGLAPSAEVLPTYRYKELQGTWTLKQTSDDAWFKFSLETLPKLRAAGWMIEYDDKFAFNLAEPSEWYADIEPKGGNDWFGVELGVQVGDEKINLLPALLNILQTRGDEFSLAKLDKLPAKRVIAIPLGDGRVVPFPAGRLRNILAVLVELYDPKSLTEHGRLELPRLRAAEVAVIGDANSWRWHGGDALRDLGERLKNFEGIRRVAAPSSLQATLRAYQEDGLSWLQFLREYNLSGILADDMGLGKTVQALAHLLIEKEAGRLDRPSLVVAPTSLMTNWRQESERFAPSLRLLVSHGLERKQNFDKLREHDLIITSYSLLSRDCEVLLNQEYHLLILDEAQFIKNPKAKFTQVACQFRARHHLCLTGTPMENHLGELWSLFNFVMPGFLGDEHRFRTLFRNPIEKAQNRERQQMLARRVGPFILRRRKADVMKELPPKTEIVQNVELGGAQRDLYESIRLAMHAKVKAEVTSKGIGRSHIIILDALLKLRQVCCDPRLVPLEVARKVQESAKLELLMDLLPEMIQEGRRILLFSQFTSMLALIEPELEKQKIAYVRLTGDTTDRATPVERFQSGAVPVFLISLKAGGTGLNLTAADTVIHYDPWWNPAVENQATDRAHRIGQDKKVFVYKLMTIGTVEEKILALQKRKRELVEGLLNEDQKEKLQLSADDLDVLFAPLEAS